MTARPDAVASVIECNLRAVARRFGISNRTAEMPVATV